MIGTVGENASLRRATCFKSTNSITLSGFTHPATNASNSSIQLGKYGAIVALHTTNDSVNNEVIKNVCQHIVGMNPNKIGVIDVDKPAENKDDEMLLVFQEYLLDPSQTVGELLINHQIQVVNFHRYECGELVQEQDKINLAKVRN